MKISDKFLTSNRLSNPEKVFYLWVLNNEKIEMNDKQISRIFKVSSTCVRNWILSLTDLQFLLIKTKLESIKVEGSKRIKVKKTREIFPLVNTLLFEELPKLHFDVNIPWLSETNEEEAKEQKTTTEC